jgi:hypothetical protein
MMPRALSTQGCHIAGHHVTIWRPPYRTPRSDCRAQCPCPTMQARRGAGNRLLSNPGSHRRCRVTASGLLAVASRSGWSATRTATIPVGVAFRQHVCQRSRRRRRERRSLPDAQLDLTVTQSVLYALKLMGLRETCTSPAQFNMRAARTVCCTSPASQPDVRSSRSIPHAR